MKTTITMSQDWTPIVLKQMKMKEKVTRNKVLNSVIDEYDEIVELKTVMKSGFITKRFKLGNFHL